MSGTKIRVTVWNEFVHERELPEIAAVYPDGIHGAIREFLETNEDIEVKTATLDEPNQGLSRDLLENTDVLIWWSHAKQEEVTDENVRLVQSEVQKGMGLIALHSAHYSKIMRQILGTPMTLKWREHDTEKLWCIDPSHFLGWFGGGEVFRSGVTFRRGYGKIFYFQPGHEEQPIYRRPDIQKIITNAVRWAAPVYRVKEFPDNIHAEH